jgi:hypothetical protein
MLISQSANSSSNTNLNNVYQFNLNSNNHVPNQQQSSKQFMAVNSDQNNMYQYCQDPFEIYLKKDEQYAEQAFHMQQLHEKMNSLNLINAQQQQQSQHNSNSNILAATSNAISLLSNQMEDRKNYLKQNFINNSNQLIKPTNNSQTQQQQQQHIQSLKQIQDMNYHKISKLKSFYITANFIVCHGKRRNSVFYMGQ